MLGLSQSPITSDRSVLAGELSLALPTSRTRTRSSARHSRLGCALSSRLLRSPQLPHRLQAPGSRLLHSSSTSPDCFPTDCAWRSARRYMGSVRRGLTFALSPLIPTGSAPSAVLIRISGEACTEQTCVKTATLHGEGTPRVCLERCCSLGTRRGWCKMSAFSELKVRRCCSLLVIGGDVV